MDRPETQNGRRQPTPADRIDVARSLPESQNVEARKRRSEGDDALASGKLDGAVRAYRAAIAADPENVRAHHNLGVAFYRQGRWEEAQACFERCIECSPREADFHFKAGLCLLKNNSPEAARQAFEAAVEQEPDHLDAQFHLALVCATGAPLASKGRRQAVRALKGILSAADRGVPCPNLDRVCFLLGSFLDDHPETREEAIAVYRRGLAADPFFAPGHNNLGVLLMETGQTLQALGVFKIAIQLEPGYPLPYRNLAQLLFDRMNPAAMEREYNAIIEDFGAQAASVLSRLSLELIDLGRAQVGESLYTRGHQIKNLMGMVGSRVRRIIRSAPPGSAGLDELRDIAREQERIYDQWVAYLRAMKQDPMNPALLDIPRLVRKVHDALAARAGGKALRFASETNVPQVKADPGMLTEAVTNLVLNALEAVDEAGRVTIQTGYDADRASVFIEVEDNGPGIPRDLQARIFDPGFSTKEKGNGYGLSICARIVSAHRGNLRVISRPGAGAVFRIDLPVDFELASGEDSIALRGAPLQAPRRPVTEEFID